MKIDRGPDMHGKLPCEAYSTGSDTGISFADGTDTMGYLRYEVAVAAAYRLNTWNELYAHCQVLEADNKSLQAMANHAHRAADKRVDDIKSAMLRCAQDLAETVGVDNPEYLSDIVDPAVMQLGLLQAKREVWQQHTDRQLDAQLARVRDCLEPLYEALTGSQLIPSTKEATPESQFSFLRDLVASAVSRLQQHRALADCDPQRYREQRDMERKRANWLRDECGSLQAKLNRKRAQCDALRDELEKKR